MKDTAFLIVVPEELSEEQRRDYIRRIAKALNEAGLQGARVTDSQTFDPNMGAIVLYQP